MENSSNLLKKENIEKLKHPMAKASDANCVGHFLKMLDLLAEGESEAVKDICKDAQAKIKASCGVYCKPIAIDKAKENKTFLHGDIFEFWRVVILTSTDLLKLYEANNNEYSYTKALTKDILDFLVTIAEKRLARLSSINDFVHPQAMQYVPYYTNISKENIVRFILQCANKFEIYEDIEPKLFTPMTSQQIISCLEDMRQIVGDKFFGILPAEERLVRQFELEALRGAFWHYNNNKQIDKFPTSHSYLAPYGFLYCEECWRMCVKHSYSTYAHCDLHNPLEKGQHIASRTKAVNATLNLRKKLLPSGITQYLQRLQSVCKPKHSFQDEDILLGMLDNVADNMQAIENLPHVEYNLTAIWEVLPHVASFLKEREANLQDPTSILNVLNPYNKDENTEQARQLRTVLHKFYERNFWFYRFELAFAELWLETYHTKFADVKHGGARKGSGGRRAGAGRKPKQK